MYATPIRERFGAPQVAAVLLLLAFLGQAAWLAANRPLRPVEMQYLNAEPGAGPAQDFDPHHPEPSRWMPRALFSPLTTEMARAARQATGDSDQQRARLAARWPFIFFGVLLGASLWYVSRRLFANAGGYIALTLYAFSPGMIAAAAAVQPEIAAAWGTFGCIFTGIAVAHTLYAPREVVLWNWKRIVLLAVAIGLGCGALLATAVAVPLALGLMLYLAPQRQRAALAIMAAASAAGALLLLAEYGFHLGALGAAAQPLASWTLSALGRGITWYMVLVFLMRNGPGFVLLLIVSLATFAAWRRTRFFGNVAPLMTAVLLVLCGLALPHAAGASFLPVMLPFLLVFVAGVSADLLETTQRSLVLGMVAAVLAMQAYWSVSGLLRLGR